MVQAYNNLLGSFPVKREVLYPARNRKELKRVYNEIVNLSKRSPYCKIDLTKENQEYVFGVKEYALELGGKLKKMQDPVAVGFDSKAIAVSDESVLSAKLLCENTENLPDTINIRVDALADVQVNKGRDLLNTSFALAPGKYSFDLNIAGKTYPLTYVQNVKTSNLEAMQEFADFINQSVQDINVTVEQGEGEDYSRLSITSVMSGRFGERDFTFEDTNTYGRGIAEYFGINSIWKEASLAYFELNGIDKKTAANTFTLENKLQVSLKNSSEDPVSIRIVPDSNIILKSVKSVINTYNGILQLAQERTSSNGEYYSAKKLINEMINISNTYQDELMACGIRTEADGTLAMEEKLAVQAAQEGGMESFFESDNGFTAKLAEKAEAIAINPMEYVDKTIVIYKKNDKNAYCNPYVTSMYSGLFFSSYC
jgi:Flagellar capping protein